MLQVGVILGVRASFVMLPDAHGSSVIWFYQFLVFKCREYMVVACMCVNVIQLHVE